MNFAEQLTYWYLRLNGFIPLTNFVLHDDTDVAQPRNEDRHRTSDADLLAVRFAHVSERIGGNPDDWDRPHFEEWGIDLTQTLGFIVEVKSGGWSADDLAARHWRVVRGVQRLGMFADPVPHEVANELSDRTRTNRDGYVIAKLLVGTHRQADVPWLYLDLRDAVRFIAQRMQRYDYRKHADRMFFDGDLIQFLAWRGGEEL